MAAELGAAINGQVAALSATIGVSDPALRLLMCILAGYPLAAVHRFVLGGAGATARHVFSLLAGFGLAWFSYGTDALHSLITILGTWLICLVGTATGMRKGAAITSWIFNMGYLLTCYWFVSTDSYDIDFTTPQCVLCLRLIGLSMDVYDGGIPADKCGADVKKCRLEQTPNPVHILSYCYYFGGFFIGPQFSFASYMQFTDRTTFKGEPQGAIPSSALATLRCVVLGIAYLGIHQVYGGSFTMTGLADASMALKPWLHRVGYMWLAGKFAFMKYFGFWLLGEGPNVLSGLGFNGRDPKTKVVRWSAVTSLNPLNFELATNIPTIVESFNMRTNAWIKQYLYKRLAFLGSREISGVSSLMFLAIWHGYSFGYFFAFGTEFLCITSERYLKSLLTPVWTRAYAVDGSIFGYIYSFLSWLTCSTTIAYGIISFDLLHKGPSLQATGHVYWFGHIICAVIIALYLIVPKPRKEKPKAQ